VEAIPKKNKPGKYHLLMDLSSPKNFSVNDGIDPVLSCLSYASIDHLSVLVLSIGRGAMLVKLKLILLKKLPSSPSGPLIVWNSIE